MSPRRIGFPVVEADRSAMTVWMQAQPPFDVVEKFVFDGFQCREYAVLRDGRELDFESMEDKHQWSRDMATTGPRRERALARFGL